VLEDLASPVLLASKHPFGVETRHIDVEDNMAVVGNLRIFVNKDRHWPSAKNSARHIPNSKEVWRNPLFSSEGSHFWCKG